MKTSFKSFAAAFAALSVAATLYAAAPDPTGTWKWSTPGRDGTPREQTLKLEIKDGALAGKIVSPRGETPISAATLGEDGAIAFTVVREFNGNRVETKYSGKLTGDTIVGSIESNRGGQARTNEWKATRQAAAP